MDISKRQYVHDRLNLMHDEMLFRWGNFAKYGEHDAKKMAGVDGFVISDKGHLSPMLNNLKRMVIERRV